MSVPSPSLIGMPLAVLARHQPPGRRAIITTVLDLMQTMPTFVYLLPVVLFFGIGACAARRLHADLRAARR